jgi:HEAT repeat protein
MSTVVGNCVPLERLKELVGDQAEANKQLIAVLLTMLDENEEVRAWASDVLTIVEEPSSAWAPQLAELTRHVNAPLAGWACKLLGRLGEQATGYQSSLATALAHHAEKSVRQLAALALKSVPNLTADTVDALRAAASDADPRLRRLALDALSTHNEV